MKRPHAGRIEALGCDVGGSAIKLVHLRRGRISSRREVLSRRRSTAKDFVQNLAEAVSELMEAAGRRLPLGVALPGFLDERRRKVLRLSNLPHLDGFPLAVRLERRLGLQVTLDADTNAGGVGEARSGAGRGLRRVFYVTLSTGLGAAMTVRGQPVRVSHHTVGQIAHIPLRTDGPRCACGQRGCAESLLSAKGIARRAGLPARASAPRALCEAADRGDATARAQWLETGELLGELLGITIPLFQPDVVVVGGGIAAAASHFLPAARKYLKKRLPRDLKGRIELKQASLGRYAGAVGAAFLGHDNA